MGVKTVHFDDLDGEESTEVQSHKFTIDGVAVDDLELKPVNFEAIETFLAKRDPSLLQAVFAPSTVARRSHEEIEAIRSAARAAKNTDGSPMFDVKNTGRLPRTMITWYETEYEPAQSEGEGEPEGTEGEADAETPTNAKARK
jgi:hypothetical protein